MDISFGNGLEDPRYLHPQLDHASLLCCYMLPRALCTMRMGVTMRVGMTMCFIVGVAMLLFILGVVRVRVWLLTAMEMSMGVRVVMQIFRWREISFGAPLAGTVMHPYPRYLMRVAMAATSPVGVAVVVVRVSVSMSTMGMRVSHSQHH